MMPADSSKRDIAMIQNQAAPALCSAIHMNAAECDALFDLALSVQRDHPQLAEMLMAELVRAELHEPGALPANTVVMNASIVFVDEGSGTQRDRTFCRRMLVATCSVATSLPSHDGGPTTSVAVATPPITGCTLCPSKSARCERVR